MRSRIGTASSSGPKVRPDSWMLTPPMKATVSRSCTYWRTSSSICPAFSSNTSTRLAVRVTSARAAPGKGHSVIGRNSPTRRPSARADLVIEAAGRDATRHQAMRMVAVEGRIGLFGVEEKPGLSTYPLAEVFRRRPTIEMTWGAQFEPGLASFAEAAADVSSGVAGLSGLVSHQIAVDGIEHAFQLAGDPQAGALKVAVTFALASGG